MSAGSREIWAAYTAVRALVARDVSAEPSPETRALIVARDALLVSYHLAVTAETKRRMAIDHISALARAAAAFKMDLATAQRVRN